MKGSQRFHLTKVTGRTIDGLSKEDLITMAGAGMIDPNDEIRKEGHTSSHLASEVTGLLDQPNVLRREKTPKEKECLKENAEDVEVIIKASSYRDAERIANQKGILVSDVLTAKEQSQKQHETSLLPTTQLVSKKKSKTKSILIIAIIAIVLFSCILGILLPLFFIMLST